MTYDPALTSFLIVGVVGGLAVFLNVSSDWEISFELARATRSWTAPLVVRRYRDDATAQERVSREAAVLRGHGYEPALRRAERLDPSLGSTAATGGRSALAGAHGSEVIVITYLLQ